MITLVSKIVFILSLLGILFIVFRKLPTLSRSTSEFSVGKFSFRVISVWFRNIIRGFSSSNFFQNTILGNLEKSLRKFKIMFLKIDNIVDKLLRKLKRKGPS